ncbi:MAG TPA: serine/threonine-protein kinase, partial [Tepidisphaeraceae bacterium]|nr:serine/threonine-protein kinase [Tepidisphaeraceae bacterium]
MAKTDLPPLRTPSAIAKFAAKVILEKLTTPSVASLIMELGLPAAQDFYERVWKKKKISEQIAEVESVAQLDPLAAVEEADAAINEVARENHLTLTDKQKAEARAYLAQLPSAIRHTLKRPEDPSGKTATQEIVPKSPQALVELLPKPSRFKAGDRVPDSTLVLQELLGVGGFGEVWRAKNPNLKSAPMVAVKFCLHPSAIDSLQRERDLLDRLQSIAPHPGIVRLRNVNLENATPWLEYDLIEGGTLASHIRQTHQKSPIDFNQITIDFTHIVEPITHAHQNGIIHRDLKPANVLVTRGKDGVEFRITDFGIGAIATEEVKRQAEQAMTQAQFTQSTFTGTFTPLYASPEQKRGEDADVRDDIYALGVIWLQMLTGNMAKDRLGRGDRKKFEAGGMDASAIDLLDAMLQPDRADRPEKVAFKIVEPK